MKRQFEPDSVDLFQKLSIPDTILYRQLPNTAQAPNDAALQLLYNMPPFLNFQQTPSIIFESQVKGKPLRLDNVGKFQTTFNEIKKSGENVILESLTSIKPNNKKKKMKLSNSQLKDRGLLHISRCHSYNSYMPLNDLWNQYIIQLIPSKISDLEVCLKISMADLHGAILTIVASNTPTYIGVHGIVLQETCRTFVIISEDNSVRTILKPHSVFEIGLPSLLIDVSANKSTFEEETSQESSSIRSSKKLLIHGKHFVYTGGMRSKQRLKPRLSLNYFTGVNE